MQIQRQQFAAVVDGRTPVGRFWRHAKAEEAKRAQQDGGVADTQAEIDDQRAAGVGQNFPQHDIPCAFTAGLASGNIVACFQIHHDAAHDAEHRGRVHEHHRHEDVEHVGVHRPHAQRVFVEGKPEIGPKPDHQRDADVKVAFGRVGEEARVEERDKEDHREDEQHRCQHHRDAGVADFRGDQQVEQQDHREGQHEVGKERQRGVQLAAEIARRQAQRDAHDEGECGGGGGDGQHATRAHHHAREHVAGKMVGTQQEIAILAIDHVFQRRAGRRVFHPAELCDRVHGDDHIREDRGVDPEHHQRKADHADGAVKQFAEQAKLALVADRKREGGDQRDPDRQELLGDAGKDLAPGKQCVVHHCLMPAGCGGSRTHSRCRRSAA